MLDGLLPLTSPGAVFTVLFLLVLVGPLIAERLRLPGLVGLVLIGMLVGPTVTGLLGGNTFIDTLGYVGLLYLMFQAGLDLDLDGFARHRRDSLVFGLATFAVPLVLVTAVARYLGIDPVAAIIIGSAFASHTLLSYETVVRFDLTRNRAVTATLGATLIATTLALLVLAVAAASARDGTGPLFWIGFGGGLVAYLAVVLVGVPRFTRWFFTGLGQDRQVRLTYLLSGMGIGAIVAELIGIEPIVGAFLIGLAFNRFVPDGTVIADRVRVLGQSLFIPAFLLSTGMMLDPVGLVSDTRTLVLGGSFVVANVVAKGVASELSGLLFGASRPERGLMFSLSVGQAAGALAAAIVASDLGLIGLTEVNAMILVILVTALLAGMTADRYAPGVEPPSHGPRRLGRRVVVPVSNLATVVPLVRVAAQVAAADSGAVVALNVLPFDAAPATVRSQRELAAEAEEAALAAGSEASTSVRIASSTVEGVLHTVVEEEGTSLVIGWKGYANAREGLFGATIDQIVARCPVPVLVCRPGEDESTERIVVVVTDDDLRPGADRGLALALEVGACLARQTESDVTVVTSLPEELLRPYLEEHDLGERDLDITAVQGVVTRLPQLLEAGDVVITGMPPSTSRLGRGARRMARAARGRTVIVAVPH